jgi:hypothetical protein
MLVDAEFAKSQDEFKEGDDLAGLPRNESCNYWLGHQLNGNCFSAGEGGQPCRLCASCRQGYTMKTSKRCSKCPGKGTTRGFLVLMFFLMFLVVMGMVAMVVKSGGKEGISDAIKKIILNWMGISALAANFPLRWPQALLDLFKFQSVIGNISEFASPDCEFSSVDKANDFYKVIAFYAILPVIVPAFFSFLWLVVACVKRKGLHDIIGKAEKFTVLDHIILTNVVTLFLMYPTICNKTISLFACKRVGPLAYLDADLQEQCFQGRHLVMVLTLGIGQIIVWVFGLPGFAVYMMRKHKQHLARPDIGFRFGLLHHGYRLERYWWEAVVCIRKVFFIFVGLLGRMAPVEIQTHMALFILFISLVLHLYFIPFESSNGVLHIMEAAALAVGWLTMWGGLMMFQLESDNEDGKEWQIIGLQGFLILINLICFFYLVGHLVREYAIEHKLEEKILGRCKGKVDKKQRELDALDGINVEHMRDVFELVDADKGGTIDCEELTVLLRMRGLSVSKLRVKSMIRNASSTGAEELNFEEFCKLMAGASGSTSELTDTLVKKMSTKAPGEDELEEEDSHAELRAENDRLKALLLEHNIDLTDTAADTTTPKEDNAVQHETVSFTVVEGMESGMEVTIRYGENKEKDFIYVIPEGVSVGTMLKVPLPLEEAGPPAPEANFVPLLPPENSAAGLNMVEVTVTEEMKPGTKAKIKYGPNKEKSVEFEIPEDAVVGSVLQIPLPRRRKTQFL